MNQNVSEVKFMLFDKNFQSFQKFTISNAVFTLALRILLNILTLSFRKDTITAKAVSLLNCLEESTIFPLQLKDLVLHSLVRSSDIFADVKMATKRVDVERKITYKPEFAYDIVRLHSLMTYTELI